MWSQLIFYNGNILQPRGYMDILYDQFSIYQTRFRTALNIIRKMRNTEASLTAYFNELIVVSDYDLMKYLIDNE